ncbi:hypothetical protein [Silvibacterium bohemicum]|uniref:hypothetical protein n=1 Tax=Silvibacterium bohemicum TaxID=1577686 RepID=UPI0018CDD042|nr:hypothetical protein [Silvibacterium bohemicum]
MVSSPYVRFRSSSLSIHLCYNFRAKRSDLSENKRAILLRKFTRQIMTASVNRLLVEVGLLLYEAITPLGKPATESRSMHPETSESEALLLGFGGFDMPTLQDDCEHRVE